MLMLILTRVDQKLFQCNTTPGEKILIIPDIHNKHEVAERIIDEESPGRIIFLGDYFDDFYDAPEDTEGTAKWLAESLERANRIHLIGNHDLSYMTKNPNLRCAGYTERKHHVIDGCGIPWGKLHLYGWIDGSWLCTHAGLSDGFFREIKQKDSDSPAETLRLAEKDLENIDKTGHEHVFFQAGFRRGGNNAVGGILWCDYDEFKDIPNTNQIFGHTQDNAVRHSKAENAEHYCIDTGLRNYITYSDKKIVVNAANFGG